MFKLLIFGGTSEGRRLAEYCASKGIYAQVSTATDYGASLLPDSPFIKKSVGRLDSEQIEDLILSGGYAMIIDATHPYAQEVSENIKAACGRLGNSSLLLRLARDVSTDICGKAFESVSGAVKYINTVDGNILSVLGSKELDSLTAVDGYRTRLFIRILPDERFKEICLSLGIRQDHIITGKGPFTVEQNISHIKQCGAKLMLTKASGAAGGYPQKVTAAERCGIQLLTILPPKDSGLSFEQIIKHMEKTIGEFS